MEGQTCLGYLNLEMRGRVYIDKGILPPMRLFKKVIYG
jgi:hypothetical protein